MSKPVDGCWSLDLNGRSEPFVERCNPLVDVAMSVLSLHPVAARMCSGAAFVIQAYQEEQGWMAVARVVSVVGLGVIFPTGFLLLSNGLVLSQDAYKLGQGIGKGDWKKIRVASWNLLSHGVYAISSYYPLPLLLAVSLCLQAIRELHKAVTCLATPTTSFRVASVGYTVLALLRLARAKTKIIEGYAQVFAREGKPHELQELFDRKIFEANVEGQGVCLQKILREYRFALKVEGVSFYERVLTCAQADGVQFRNCNFQYSTWKNSSFRNVGIHGSDLTGALFGQCSFEGVEITGSRLSGVRMIACKLKDCSFTDSDLTRACFNESEMLNLLVTRVQLVWASFLHARVSGVSRLEDCQLKNAFLLRAEKTFEIFGGTQPEITVPVVAVGVDFADVGPFTAKAIAIVGEHNVFPLLYQQAVWGEESPALQQEVHKALAGVEEGEESFSRQILRKAQRGSEIDRIKDWAAEVMEASSGLVLPGGENVPENFYNKSGSRGGGVTRTVREIALLAEAIQQKIPVWAICRGAQLCNVFFGGSLRELGGWQSGLSRFVFAQGSHVKWLQDNTVGPFLGVSAHSQAVDRIGLGLQCVLSGSDGVPKLLVSEDGLILASQMHAEAAREFPDPRIQYNHYPIFLRFFDAVRKRFAASGKRG